VAKSPADARAAASLPSGGYLHWSRDAAVGCCAVLPLWLLYEGLRLLLTPEERNGAEALLLREIGRLGVPGHLVLTAAFALLTLLSAASLKRRDVPWMRIAAVIALEGTLYALLLGPLSQQLASSAQRLLATGVVPSSLAANLVHSIGAGVFEELVFRLGLMSLLVWLVLRPVRAWSLPSWTAGVVAVVVSALVFSWFHHLCGEPWDSGRFTYRAMAGLLLGVLMWVRGFGVCVYTHAIYDVWFYLSADGS